MRLRVNGPKDLLAGLIFIVFGLSTFALAQGYKIGTAFQMGPGYFPAAMGLVLAAIGVAAVVRGITIQVPDPIEPHRLEPLFLLFAGIVAFSLLIERVGLVIAAAVLIAIICFRRLLSHPVEVLVTYAALTGFSALVFVVLFDMQIPLFWWR